MTIQIIGTQLAELAIIAKHLHAMDAELMESRQAQDWVWGDGMWTNISEIVVRTDADEMLGKFAPTDVGGFDWESA